MTPTLAPWRSVGQLGVADDGWLVTGSPTDGPSGIYLLDDQGRHELLVSGSGLYGIRLSAGQLTFPSSEQLPEGQSWNSTVVYRIAEHDARALGPTCQPFSRSTLALLAGRALEALDQPTGGRYPLDSRAGLHASCSGHLEWACGPRSRAADQQHGRDARRGSQRIDL